MPKFFKKLPRLWRNVIWVLLVFLAGFLLANFVLMPLIVRQGSVVEVPDVRGLGLKQAQEILQARELELVNAGWRYDAALPDSSIISQDPEPRMMVKKRRKVRVIINRGEEKVPVPYLAGLSSVRAINLIDRLGLAVTEVDSISSDSIALGCVVSSSPAAGALLAKKSAIKLTLSKGPTGKMLMPDLVGRKLAEIQGQLVGQGLVIGQIKYISGQALEPGTVMLQAPQPGFVIKQGDTVNLAVSTQ
ncbi:MAG: PASTA domain-containing protein [Candidatus Edwardsbacteria bacterium]|nr:PASTA domain-containing protein [Candidatus Edwardsbacteria bacterium]